MVETYLEVIGCLGAALVVLLVGEMDFKIVDGFVMGFLDWIHFSARECEWFMGEGGQGR